VRLCQYRVHPAFLLHVCPPQGVFRAAEDPHTRRVYSDFFNFFFANASIAGVLVPIFRTLIFTIPFTVTTARPPTQDRCLSTLRCATLSALMLGAGSGPRSPPLPCFGVHRWARTTLTAGTCLPVRPCPALWGLFEAPLAQSCSRGAPESLPRAGPQMIGNDLYSPAGRLLGSSPWSDSTFTPLDHRSPCTSTLPRLSVSRILHSGASSSSCSESARPFRRVFPFCRPLPTDLFDWALVEPFLNQVFHCFYAGTPCPPTGPGLDEYFLAGSFRPFHHTNARLLNWFSKLRPPPPRKHHRSLSETVSLPDLRELYSLPNRTHFFLDDGLFPASWLFSIV